MGIADIDAGTGTETGEEILSASKRAVVVVSAWSTPTNGALEPGVRLWSYGNSLEANGAEDLGVIKVPTLVCEADLYSRVVFAGRSVLPITINLVAFHIPDWNIHTVHLSLRYSSQSLNLCSSMTKPADMISWESWATLSVIPFLGGLSLDMMVVVQRAVQWLYGLLSTSHGEAWNGYWRYS